MSGAISKPRVLIVYYSRTGNTESVAQGLSRAMGADLEAIEDVASRRGIWGYLRAGYEGTFGRSASIRAARHEPRNYDLVLIGSPTWNAALCSPVRAYLERYGSALSDVAFFATCGGRGADKVLRQMAELTGRKPLAQLTLTERDLKGRFAVYLAEFVEELMKLWDARATQPDHGALAAAP